MIVKRVRNLDDAYSGVGEETHGTHKKIALHDEIRIEQGKKFGIRLRQRVIDIAGFCVRVIRTGDIPHALRLTKLL